MSLINQMLQELESRRSDATGSDVYGQQIRAVPDRRSIHPAWWVALGFACIASALLAWVLLRPAPVLVPSSTLPLKFDTDLDSVSPASRPAPAVMEGSRSPDAASPDADIPAPVVNAPVPVVAPVEAAPVSEALQPPKPAAQHVDTVQRVSRESAVPKERSETSAPATSKSEKDVAVPRSSTKPVPQPADRQGTGLESTKHFKELTAQQRAENEYRKALGPMQQGKMTEAIAGLEQALQLDPRHAGARQALIGVFLENNRTDDAMRIAREGLTADLAQPELAMILARLQLDKGAQREAIQTLEHSLPYSAQRADYPAFLAALLQREGKHKQAIENYLQALRLAPQNGVWWMGLGISLQADNRLPEAREAFNRAKGSNTLSAELLEFVDGKLRQLSH